MGGWGGGGGGGQEEERGLNAVKTIMQSLGVGGKFCEDHYAILSRDSSEPSVGAAKEFSMIT